ncbi:MATE family efflux transporter, partial [Proteus mirabilis]|uniref:MATE family efflux transporter n=1 Tax=Proteus mirabilis TaxID=584 RepID=UPI002574AE46
GVVDTVMARAVNATEMSAVAVGTSIWMPTILLGQGILMALTPIVAQLNGSGLRKLIANLTQKGFWLATFLSIMVIAILYNSRFII